MATRTCVDSLLLLFATYVTFALYAHCVQILSLEIDSIHISYTKQVHLMFAAHTL